MKSFNNLTKELVQEASVNKNLTIKYVKGLAKLVSGVKVINRDTAVMTDTTKVSELSKTLKLMGYVSKDSGDGSIIYKKGVSQISISWDDSQSKATIVVG
jgi:hypothetical protein